jgi:glutamate synthase (NADPH/NADH) large chain
MNTCPVGIATQNPDLRKRFTAKPEHIINFFTYLARELREIMAKLGFYTIDEMVGKVEMLKVNKDLPHWKYKQLDLSPILYKEPADEAIGQYKTVEQDHDLAQVLDRKLIKAAKSALTAGKAVEKSFPIFNTDRSVGTMLSNEISKKWGSAALPTGLIQFHFRGSAGQSFGAFGAKGLEFSLEGESNDYFGKGLSGATLSVVPDRVATFNPSENIIIGNVALYGATSGEVFIKGMAGERFAVRNSGAQAVVEGTGDHCCEYMTGGRVVILGETGVNFAAGMSGGIAFVFNPKGDFEKKLNKEMVALEALEVADFKFVKTLIRKHFKKTESDLAKSILDKWETVKTDFVKVMPVDYKRVLQEKSTQDASPEMVLQT